MKATDQLVIEKPVPLGERSAMAASAIKSILFHVHDDDRLEARLQSALSFWCPALSSAVRIAATRGARNRRFAGAALATTLSGSLFAFSRVIPIGVAG